MFDFRPHCAPCLWCCHGERVFVSPDEQARIGPDAFTGVETKDGDCEKLDTATGRCTVHANRPTECRLFPLDLLPVDGVVHWVVGHGACPAVPHLPADYITQQTSEWDATLDPAWVRAYVAHHLVNQPDKYRPGMFTVVRPYAGTTR